MDCDGLFSTAWGNTKSPVSTHARARSTVWTSQMLREAAQVTRGVPATLSDDLQDLTFLINPAASCDTLVGAVKSPQGEAHEHRRGKGQRCGVRPKQEELLFTLFYRRFHSNIFPTVPTPKDTLPHSRNQRRLNLPAEFHTSPQRPTSGGAVLAPMDRPNAV